MIDNDCEVVQNIFFVHHTTCLSISVHFKNDKTIFETNLSYCQACSVFVSTSIQLLNIHCKFQCEFRSKLVCIYSELNHTQRSIFCKAFVLLFWVIELSIPVLILCWFSFVPFGMNESQKCWFVLSRFFLNKSSDEGADLCE